MRRGPIVLALLLSMPTWAEERRAKVVMVSEGDLLTVLDGDSTITLRLEGVDCPEPGQPFADRARRLTAAITLGKTVSVRVTGELSVSTLSDGDAVSLSDGLVPAPRGGQRRC